MISDNIDSVDSRDDLTDHHIEIVRDIGDGEHILVRSRRSVKTDVCKFKKGDWSACDKLVMVSTTAEVSSSN